VLAARVLEALRSGLEARAGSLLLLTPTVNPEHFGGVVVGWQDWGRDGLPCLPGDAVRTSRLWSEPTREQFERCARAMSREFDRLMKRLNMKAKRAGLEPFAYFRVVELHRNGWPHYHVVLEHPTGSLDVLEQVNAWGLGRVDVRPVDLDAAVGEVAPYLVSAERKGAGSKAYQFAATALPKHFRLHSSSRGFLLRSEADLEAPVESVVLRGHFSGYHQWVQSFSSAFGYEVDARLVLPSPAPPDRDHKPPSSSVSTGDGAVLLFVQLLDQESLRAPPVWFKPMLEAVSAAPDRGPKPS
jgi:hypothetical protein